MFIKRLSPKYYFRDEEMPSRVGVTCLAVFFLPVPQTPKIKDQPCYVLTEYPSIEGQCHSP